MLAWNLKSRIQEVTVGVALCQCHFFLSIIIICFFNKSVHGNSLYTTHVPNTSVIWCTRFASSHFKTVSVLASLTYILTVLWGVLWLFWCHRECLHCHFFTSSYPISILVQCVILILTSFFFLLKNSDVLFHRDFKAIYKKILINI